jgi:hypothetical protein
MSKLLISQLTFVSTVATAALGATGCVAPADASDPDSHTAETADDLQVQPAFDPGKGPFCTFNCGPLSGAVTASPSFVTLPPNTAGNTTIHWTWNESKATPVAAYACLYVNVNNAATMSVVDCEHPGNNYTVPVSWIVAPNSYEFIVALSNLANPPSVPKGSLPQLSATVVTGILGP